jgi:phosphoribosyl 1,2-cyclic phosphodiesterase
MMFGGNTSCVQVTIRDSEDYLILDSGSGIRTLGNALVQHGREVHGHIFITHAHWDHIQGFPFFRPIYEPASSLAIHMPRQKLGGCKTVLTTQFTPTYFPVTVDMLNARIQYVTQESEPVQYDGYTMEFMMANHPVETAIYKFTHEGKTVVYAPDNERTAPLAISVVPAVPPSDVALLAATVPALTVVAPV